MERLPVAIVIPPRLPPPPEVLAAQPLTLAEEVEITCFMAYEPMRQEFRACVGALRASTNASIDAAAYSIRAASYANLAMQHLTLARLSMRVPQVDPPKVFTN